MAERPADQKQQVDETAPKVKKPYSKPLVEDLGTLAELTQGAGVTGSVDGNGST